MELPDTQVHELLDASPDPTVVVNERGDIVFVSAQVFPVFGYEPHELIGTPVESLLPERFRAAHPGHRSNYFEHPKPRPMGAGLQLYGRRKDGSEFPVEISLSPVKTPQSMLVLSAIRDVTAHIEIERALGNAREVAESATATKSRFLAAASHDLRQPLQSIGIYLAVLDRQLEQPGNKEISDKIRCSLDVMGELLDALLDISKLDAGSISPEPRNMPVDDLFKRIIIDNEPAAAAKGLALRCDATSFTVHSDPALLQRIVENFVTNAIRYTETGEVMIQCRCDGDIVRIEVHDTGVGIPSESIDSIFEEYYQLDNPVRDRRKGLGLGLAIAKHIARILDHRLDVQSIPGQGSTFAVEVPLGAPIEQPREPQPSVKASARAGRQPVVLFVDDDPAIVDATRMLLASADMQVHYALSGDEALALIADGVRPNLVVSDYRLPGYTGAELIRRLRRATVDRLPTVLMTGDTSLREIEAERLPNCLILHKPVDSDRLISMIEDITT